MELFDETKFPASKTVGVTSEVTLITPIKKGRIEGEYRTYRERLESVLDGLQEREGEGKPTPIGSLRQIHFARWIVCEPQGGGQPLLIFTSNFDGEMKHYFRNSALNLPDDIDRVWQNCEGYPGAHDFDKLWQYVKRHQVETRAFYNAYRSLTVPQILKLDALKKGLDEIMAAHARQEGGAASPEGLAKALHELLAKMQPPQTPGRRPESVDDQRPSGHGEVAALERQDIQANIVESPPWKHAAYFFLTITDATAFRESLRQLIEGRGKALGFIAAAEVAGAKAERSLDRSVNIAFTWSGLERLGVAEEHLAALPLAVRDGMAARARILGDIGGSAPEQWDGMLGRKEVHAVIAAYTMGDANHAGRLYERDVLAALAGFRLVHREFGYRTERDGYAVEPFGFRHGISQPEIEQGGRDGDKAGLRSPNAVPAGEFILKYPDADGNDQIAPELVGPTVRELCSNGTFMVFRKLEQDVPAFEEFRRQHGADVAHRLIGRRTDGTSLALDRPASEAALASDGLDDFDYRNDVAGQRCPFASHVRRVNPRDDLMAEEWRRHRILRRGIPYEKDGKKGVLFVCFNARIDAQFEFLQSEWCDKGDFLGLFTDVRDPIVGGGGGTFVFPDQRTALADLTRFVTAKGGDYFFVPGIQALRLILEGRFDAPAASSPSAPMAEEASPDTLDPVAYAAKLMREDTARLLHERSIVAKRIAWPSGREQAIYYVACQDHVRKILADDTSFTSDQYRRKMEKLLAGYDLAPWRREGEAQGPDPAPLRRVLLGMPASDPEKAERLRILREAVGTEGATEMGKRIGEIAAPIVAAAIDASKRTGVLDVVKLAYAVPIGLAIGSFGAPAPAGTRFCDAYVAAYFDRTSIEDVRRLGWPEPAYDQRQGPAEELFGLVHPIAIFLLIDDYDTPDAREFAKGGVTELLNRIARAAIAEEQRIAAGAAPEAADTLLARMLRCRPADVDPATHRLRVGMILAELIVGSIDTAAKAITNLVDCLLSEPKALEQARTADDAKLDQIILEALRLQPVAPLILRECPGGATPSLFIGGAVRDYRFEPGSRIFLLTAAAMRDPVIGLDGKQLELDLSKFLINGTNGVPIELEELDRIRSLVFGDGPHACFGRHIVLAELRAVLRQLLKLKNLRRATGPEGQKEERLALPVSLKVRFDRDNSLSPG